MIDENRMLERFLEYVQIDSESFDEDRFAEKLICDLEKIGISASQDQIGNLFFTLPGEQTEEPILFTAHMDTVVPGKNICPFVQDGMIASNGKTILGGDDKSGIVEILEAIQTIQEHKLAHRPIEVMFTVQEESGLTGSANADLNWSRAKYSLAVDGCGPMDEIVISGAGQATMTVKITGLAAHAGECPDKGISAIMVAAEAISAMTLLKIDEETTANIGSLRADNPTNIVCDSIEFKAEVRSRNTNKLYKQIEHMKNCIDKACKKYGANFNMEVNYPYKGYLIQDQKFLNIVKNAYEKKGVLCKYGMTMVGSDSNILNQRGKKAIVIPSGMQNPHALTERIAVIDMVLAAEILLELMRA